MESNISEADFKDKLDEMNDKGLILAKQNR